MIKQVSQSDGWHHVVVSVHIDVVTRLGMAKVYFDGRRVGKTVVDCKFTLSPGNCVCRLSIQCVRFDLHQSNQKHYYFFNIVVARKFTRMIKWSFLDVIGSFR